MKAQWSLLCAALAVLGNLSAQENQSPQPPAELAKFSPMIGSWEGKGVTMLTADGPEVPWTATSRYKKTLNDFFVSEETVVNLGPELPKLVILILYGFDASTQRYRSIALDNMTGVWDAEIRWEGDNTMVFANAGVEDGQVAVDRWVTKVTQDSISFVGTRCAGSGPFFDMVKGTMRRAEDVAAGTDPQEANSTVPAPAEMAKLLRMKGHYRLKGSYKMGPEVPAVEISGDEEIVDFFDGLVMGVRVKGDPVEGLGLPAFEGYAAFSWDAAKSCYKTVFANNMGELGSSEGRWAGDDLVVTGSRMQMGQPVLSRTLVKVDGDGRVQSAEAHALVGVTEPLKTFEASYTLQPD